MNYNFDEIVDRRNSDCLKYDFAEKRGKPKDILPLWVADMDFKTPPEVIEALVTKSRHGIFGYSDVGDDYFNVLQSWFSRYFKWTIEQPWLVKTPGIVFAICTAIRALTSKGDAVLIQQPVYYPFSESVLVNDRKLVVNELIFDQGSYSIDWQDFESKIIQNQVKLFILCSPHNPVGRVWTEAELLRVGDICLQHGVTVISDEIHADFVFPGHRHLVFANLKPEFAEITITCTAPTKTFNLAGLQVSNILIANPVIRKQILREISRCGFSQLGIMGLTACRAAYSSGHQWLAELNNYLDGNRQYMSYFFAQKLPQIKMIEPEGTYLAWLDCRDLGFDDAELDRLIIHKAGLWLNSGRIFGAGGEGFQRINFACPRATLTEALSRLEQTFTSST